MRPEEKELWRIYVQAKAKNFRFKFRAIKCLPNWRSAGTRFSVLLELQRFLPKVKTQPGISTPSRRNSFKSKFCRVFRKLLSRRVKNEVAATERTAYERILETSYLRNQLKQLIYWVCFLFIFSFHRSPYIT